MIHSRRIAMPVAAVAILAAVLVVPAAPAQAAPASPAEVSTLASLWQPLADGLSRLEAGVLGLFAASTTDPDLDPGTEIGRGADPNGILADPDLGTTSTPSHDPGSGD